MKAGRDIAGHDPRQRTDAIEAEVARIDLLIEAVTLHRDSRALPDKRRAALVAAQSASARHRATGVFAELIAAIPAADSDLALDCLMIAAFGLARPSRARALLSLTGTAPGSDGALTQGLLHELLMPDAALERRLGHLLSGASPLLRQGLLRAEGEGPARALRPGIRLARFVTGAEALLSPPDGVRLVHSPGEPLPPLRLAAPAARRLAEIETLIRFATARPEALIAGPAVLFTGGPGTGKTLAVRHIADRLGRPLYQIDLGRVISKWVGETERNFSRIFGELAGTEGCILIDEADAVLGKRVEVRESRDQYANITVSHLLSLLEHHRGPVFLTTNLRGNLDPAYVRRFGAVAEFRRPDARIRRRIWADALSRVSGLSPDRLPPDLLDLAAGVELTAAEIANVAVVAAALATGPSLPGAAELARAIWLEKTKTGLTFARSDLGTLAPHLTEDPEDAD
jgi:hypothetical protein